MLFTRQVAHIGKKTMLIKALFSLIWRGLDRWIVRIRVINPVDWWSNFECFNHFFFSILRHTHQNPLSLCLLSWLVFSLLRCWCSQIHHMLTTIIVVSAVRMLWFNCFLCFKVFPNQFQFIFLILLLNKIKWRKKMTWNCFWSLVLYHIIKCGGKFLIKPEWKALIIKLLH